MPTLAHRVRLAAHRLGVDVVRYPRSDPMWRAVQLLRSQGVDTVIDVGANDGGYATAIRKHGFEGRLYSFEPLTAPFRRLRAKADGDPRWTTMRYAIGDQEGGTITINIAGNAEASSSVLPMLSAHTDVAPTTAYIGTEEAPIHRLDDVMLKMGVPPTATVFLKVDVQGYEAAVLDGAADLLRNGVIAGMQLELSFVPLYDGAMTWQEGIERAAALGMSVMAVEPGFSDPSTGRTLQADFTFFRTPEPS